MRLTNQLESGTSSSVLTFSARTSRRSPGVREGIDDEVVAVRVLDRHDGRRIQRRVVVDPQRIVGIEARPGALSSARNRAQHGEGRRESDRTRRPRAPLRARLEPAAEDDPEMLAIATPKRASTRRMMPLSVLKRNPKP